MNSNRRDERRASHHRPRRDGRRKSDGYAIGESDSEENEDALAENASLMLCRFAHPETYTFDTYSGRRGSVDRLVVDVTDVTDAGMATVRLRYEMATRTVEDTVVGSAANGGLWTSLGLSLAGGMFVSRPVRTVLSYCASRDGVTVGEVWSPAATVAGQPSAIEITGRATHAGVACYTFRASTNAHGGETVAEGCLSPALQLVPRLTATDAEGTVSFETSLVEYERP